MVDVFGAGAANGFVPHEPPESRHVLLQLPINDIRAMAPQIAPAPRLLIRILQRRQPRPVIEVGGDGGRWRQIAVVILVTEDELARRHAGAGDPGNRRLGDAVVKPERLVIAVGTVAALHVARPLDDGPGGVGNQRAQRRTGAFEFTGGDRVDDDDSVNRRLAGGAQLPLARIAFGGVAEDSRARGVRHPLLELLRERAEDARRQANGGEASGGECQVPGDCGLELLAARGERPWPRRRDGGATCPSQRRAPAASCSWTKR